jgi:hypothetical protein
VPAISPPSSFREQIYALQVITAEPKRHYSICAGNEERKPTFGNQWLITEGKKWRLRYMGDTLYRGCTGSTMKCNTLGSGKGKVILKCYGKEV